MQYVALMVRKFELTQLHEINYAYIYTDYFTLANPSLETIGGLCPARNDETALSQSSGGVGPSAFLSNVPSADLIGFNNPFCLAFAASTNPGNTEPLFSILRTDSTVALQVVITDTEITLTLQNTSVIFQGTQFADGSMQRIQVCVAGGRATLYLNCVNTGIGDLDPGPIDDIANGIAFLFQAIGATAMFDVREYKSMITCNKLILF